MTLTYLVCVMFFVGGIYETFAIWKLLHTSGIHRILCFLVILRRIVVF